MHVACNQCLKLCSHISTLVFAQGNVHLVNSTFVQFASVDEITQVHIALSNVRAVSHGTGSAQLCFHLHCTCTLACRPPVKVW